MSRVKLALCAPLVALLVSACGIAAKPTVGSPSLNHEQTGFYGRIDTPRVHRYACMKKDLKKLGVAARAYKTPKQHFPAVQVGTLPNGPTVIFYPTPGMADGQQIMDKEQGAEIIGAALVYPNQGSARVLSIVETCAAIDVSG